MSMLFSEYTMKNLQLKNRIVMAPMCLDSSINGYANEWHFIHYTTRAIGGVGLILLEATAVESCGRITDRDLGIWEDSHIEELEHIVKACHSNGAKIGIQLNHAGRKAEMLTEPIIAPSPIAFSEKYRIPKEMSKDDILRLVNLFKDAAARSVTAGFDLIELHGAHGYLINQFLSPVTNRRTDEYGGCAENRVRFLREIIAAMKTVCPEDMPILVRVSAEEYIEGGNTPEKTSELISLIKDFGLDAVDVSSGAVAPASISVYPGYQIKYSETIKEICNIPTIAGGLITSALTAEEILGDNRADLVYFGRELLRNPYFPLQAAQLLGDDIEWPVQYLRSKNIKKNGF